MPVRKGPVQGAAIGPQIMPSTRAPQKPEPPELARRFFNPEGRSSSNAPNMEAASTRNSALKLTMTHGLESKLPNTPPVRPATTPSGTNISTMPATNAAESRKPSKRLLTLRAPNTLTVTATIGYTQGVKLTSRPLANAARVAYRGPSDSACAKPPSLGAAAAEALSSAAQSRTAQDTVARASASAPRAGCVTRNDRLDEERNMIKPWRAPRHR